jgi:hypothetical protein
MMELISSGPLRNPHKKWCRSLRLYPLPVHDVQSVCADLAYLMVDPIPCELGRYEQQQDWPGQVYLRTDPPK